MQFKELGLTLQRHRDEKEQCAARAKAVTHGIAAMNTLMQNSMCTLSRGYVSDTCQSMKQGNFWHLKLHNQVSHAR